jgi:serine/threonine protein kinase/tetratricopeptide (TPR) repeat protein
MIELRTATRANPAILICPSCRTGALGPTSTCASCAADLTRERRRGGEDLVGMLLEKRYRTEEFIGQGAMSWVYRATHLGLDFPVAAKILKPFSPNESGKRDARFEREARAASRLSHPHIISVVDFGQTPGGLRYLITEFLKGKTLAALLHGPAALGLDRAIRLFTQILAAVEEAHHNGVIHRDLKPDNIMVTSLSLGDEFIKVLDFGLAKLQPEAARGLQGGDRLTLAGEVCGTPAYMSPEQITGGEVTTRSDLYALGLLLYEMLVGRVPFEGVSLTEVLTKQIYSEPTLPSLAAPDRNLPPLLDEVILRALRKAPEDRFGTVAELRAALAVAIDTFGEVSLPCTGCGRATPGGRCTSPLHCSRTADGTDGSVVDDLEELQELQDLEVLRRTGPGLDPGRTTPSSAARTAAAPVPVRARTASAAPTAPSRLERRLLLEGIDAFLDGSTGILQIVGPEGSGRSTLLLELARRSAERGLACVSTEPDPMLPHKPWSAAIRLLESHLLGETLSGDRVAALEASLTRIGIGGSRASLVLSLFDRNRLGFSSEPDARRYAILELCVRILLGRQGEETVFLIDDEDRCDLVSRSLFQLLARVIPGRRCRLALVAEAPCLPEGSRCQVLEVGPLGEAEVSELIEGTLASVATQEGTTTALSRLSSFLSVHPLQRIPLVVDQAVRHVLEGGADPTRPIGEVCAARVAALAEGPRRLLEAACAIGCEVPLALLARVEGGDSVSRDQALSELEHRGLVRIVRDRAGAPRSLRLLHRVVAEAALGGLADEVRRALHLSIFGELQKGGADPFLLAHHASLAGIESSALDLLERAGDLATDLLDDATAAFHAYRPAQQLARFGLLLGEDDPRSLVLARKLGGALRVSGHHRASELVIKEALGASEGHPGLRARLLLELSHLVEARGLLEEARVPVCEAIGCARAEGGAGLLAEAYRRLGELLEKTGATDEALAALEEGILLATSDRGLDVPEGPPELTRLFLLQAELAVDARRFDTAQRAATAALRLDTRTSSRDPSLTGRIHLQIARALLGAGGAVRAKLHLETARSTFDRIADRRRLTLCDQLLEQISG